MRLIDLFREKTFRRVKDQRVFELKGTARDYIILQNTEEVRPVYESYLKFLKTYEMIDAESEENL